LIRSVCNGGDDQPRQFSAVDELGGTFHWVGPTCKKKHHCMRMVPSRVLVNSLSLSLTSSFSICRRSANTAVVHLCCREL
jgi:hypothetical protein